MYDMARLTLLSELEAGSVRRCVEAPGTVFYMMARWQIER